MRGEGGDAGDALRIAYPYYVFRTVGTQRVLRIAYPYYVLRAVGAEAYYVLRIRITYYGFELRSVLRIAYLYYVLRL